MYYPLEEQIIMLSEKEKTKSLRDFKMSSKKEGFHIRIREEEFAYNQAREISNSYFDHKPRAVGYPRNTTQVMQCFTFCMKNKFKVRLRSGGHQHEGMSSADDVFMIRLSAINFIEYADDNKQTAWIGVGCKLKAVYDELQLDNKMIPGGGCFNVNVGGLTLGGGWGMNSRKYGLTCDNIIAAEIVFVNKEGILDNEIVSNENKPKLFKALRGGGGGNFGIVTRFLFKLHEVSPHISTFSIYWSSTNLKEITEKWLERQASLTSNITTFLRIQNINDSKKYSGPYLFRAYGLYHGKKSDLKTIAEELLKDFPDLDKTKIEYKPKDKPKTRGLSATANNDTPRNFLADLFNYDVFPHFEMDTTPLVGSSDNEAVEYKYAAAPPSSNCDVPHPHKVSSIFSNKKAYKKVKKISNKEYYEEIAKRVDTYFKVNRYKHIDPKEVTSYMTFHSMGGNIKKEPEGGSSFAFRNREFLMQFQAWWNYSKKEKESLAKKDDPASKLEPTPDEIAKRETPYIHWVTGFRAFMSEGELTQGAFINFVDKFGVDTKDSDKKYNLLKVYYGSKLEDLIKAKQEYDSKDFFKFDMSIPV